MGYQEEMGYNQFFYPNLKNIRQILYWLLPKIPQDEQKILEVEATPRQLFELRVRKEIKKHFQMPILAPQCKVSYQNLYEYIYKEKNEYFTSEPFDLAPFILPECRHIYQFQSQKIKRDSEINWQQIDQIRNQISEQEALQVLSPTLVEQKKSEKESRVQQYCQKLLETLNRPLKQFESLSSLPPTQDPEILKMRKELYQLEEKILERKNELTKLEKEQNSLMNQQETLQLQQKQNSLNREIADYLQKGQHGLNELNKEIDQLESNLKELQEQWDEYREPFDQKLEQLSNKNAQEVNDSLIKLKRIDKMKKEVEKMQKEMPHTKQMHENLLLKFEQWAKSKKQTRQEYLDKLSDLQKSLYNQDMEIQKVKKDTQALQNELSQLQSKLAKQYQLTESLLKPSTKNAGLNFTQQSFSYLTKLHATFSSLTALWTELGQLQNENRLLKEKIAVMEEDGIEKRFQQLLKDLNSIKNK